MAAEVESPLLTTEELDSSGVQLIDLPPAPGHVNSISRQHQHLTSAPCNSPSPSEMRPPPVMQVTPRLVQSYRARSQTAVRPATAAKYSPPIRMASSPTCRIQPEGHALVGGVWLGGAPPPSSSDRATVRPASATIANARSAATAAAAAATPAAAPPTAAPPRDPSEEEVNALLNKVGSMATSELRGSEAPRMLNCALRALSTSDCATLAFLLPPARLPRLTTLNLSHNKLSDGAAIVLGRALAAGAPALCKVALQENEIGDVGMMALAAAMRPGGAPGMQDIKLAFNRIGDDGAVGEWSAEGHLAEDICTYSCACAYAHVRMCMYACACTHVHVRMCMYMRMWSWQHMCPHEGGGEGHVARCPENAYAHAHTRPLAACSARTCKLTRTCPRMRGKRRTRSPPTPSALLTVRLWILPPSCSCAAIASAWREGGGSKLRDLHAAANQIGSTGLAALAAELHAAAELRTLTLGSSLGGNLVGDEGAAALDRALRMNGLRSLTVVLKNNALSDDAIVGLQATLKDLGPEMRLVLK